MLKNELIRLDVAAETAEAALRLMAQLFVDAGVAKPGYPAAIVDREAKYPTGLPASAFDIAVPHTFAEHVNEPAMGICVLREPVEFKQMGSPEIILHPQVLFMLAITDPKDQIKLLKRIMKLIQNPEALYRIKGAESVREVYSVVNPLLFQET